MTRVHAAERLRRVLALVPYIASRGEATIGELSRAFGVPEDAIRSDLEVLPFCGLPPYTPDRLIDVAVIDDAVSLRFAEYFARPLRLTPAEGFALLAAGRALLAVPGSEATGPLATALEKLEAALGAGDVVEVDMGGHEHLDALQGAAAGRERVEIDYYSFGRDAVTTRAIDPYTVASLEGQWYVAGFCHEAGDERLFRIDRIHAVRPTGERFDAPSTSAAPADTFSPSPEDVRVTIDLPPAAAWVAEAYPVESVEERRGGRVRVVLAVAGSAFLGRLLLLAGPDAKVIAPKSLKALGAETARRVLTRYPASPESGPRRRSAKMGGHVG